MSYLNDFHPRRFHNRHSGVLCSENRLLRSTRSHTSVCEMGQVFPCGRGACLRDRNAATWRWTGLEQKLNSVRKQREGAEVVEHAISFPGVESGATVNGPRLL
jgi:hypothetical protein